MHPGSSFWGGMGPQQGLLPIALTAHHETAPRSMQARPGYVSQKQKNPTHSSSGQGIGAPGLVGEMLASFR